MLRQPNEYKRHRSDGKKGDSAIKIEAVPIQVDDEEVEVEIKSILEKNEYDKPEDIPSDGEDAVQCWKLRVKLSAIILQRVLAESSDKAATEVFQALAAVKEAAEKAYEDPRLLRFLIDKLKEAETRQQVLDGASIPNVTVSEFDISEERHLE